MSQFCTMCEEYYNDPNKHRYVECMYYNGCDCGVPNPGRGHIRSCRTVLERKRKASEKRAAPPMLSNSLPYPEEATCAMCLIKYRGSSTDHRMTVCAYYNGCPHCKKKYFEAGHMRKCEEEMRLKDAGFGHGAGDVKYSCRNCSAFIDAFKYDAHVASCNGEVKDDDETKVFPAVTPEVPKTLCPFCLLKISDEYFESHQKSCFESVERKFSCNTSYYGEPQVIDVRVKKGEKAVRFQEGASP